jgi:hypothetical protein
MSNYPSSGLAGGLMVLTSRLLPHKAKAARGKGGARDRGRPDRKTLCQEKPLICEISQVRWRQLRQSAWDLSIYGFAGCSAPRAAPVVAAKNTAESPKKKAERNARPKSNREVKAEDKVTHALEFD